MNIENKLKALIIENKLKALMECANLKVSIALKDINHFEENYGNFDCPYIRVKCEVVTSNQAYAKGIQDALTIIKE